MSLPLRVLLVEDSDDDALLISRELQAIGFAPEIERVETAPAMRDALDRQSWDIAISDYVLPRFSALAAVAVVRERELDLPMIIVSGAIGEEMAVAAMRAGAHDFIRKGNWARLGPAIERELNEAASRRERQRAEAERAALALENARLVQEAQEAVRARNLLLATVTHDLKNPLTGISGQAQVLLRQLQRPVSLPTDVILERVTRIEESAADMNRLLDEMMDFSRLQLGQPLDLQRRPTELVALTLQIARSQEAIAERHDIRLAADVDRLVGDWDPIRLKRVIANLLDNAIKYSPDGGEITLTVRSDQSSGESVAVLEIADHGIGIPPGDLPLVFDRFHRAGNVVGRISGTGIGLAIARQIIEQHGGSIGVVSTEGAGTTFTVRLPLTSPND